MAERVAIVTNISCYAGPGAVEALAAKDMIVACHDTSFLDEGARRAFERDNPRCIALAEQSGEALVSEALSRLGRINVLVSNDYADTLSGPLEKRSPVEYRQLLDRLAVAPYALVRAVAPAMKQTDGGNIILITSGAPLTNPPEMAAYTSARAAANGLVKVLAREFGIHRISINAIAPIYLDSHYTPQGMDDPAVAEAVRQRIPLQRLGSQREIGALIELLASDRGAFVSGQIIAFSGGAG